MTGNGIIRSITRTGKKKGLNTMRVIKARTTKGPCRSCRYAKTGNMKVYRNGILWCAVCTNKDSDYYKALLNVNRHGRLYPNVCWEGCYQYKKKAPAIGELTSAISNKTIVSIADKGVTDETI